MEADTDAAAWQRLAGESERERDDLLLIAAALVARHGSAVLLTPAELKACDPSRLARAAGPDGVRLWIRAKEASDG